MRSYDVIVIGLGGTGSAAAYHLAKRGARVLGLERFTPTHDRGASHGGSRMTREACFEGSAHTRLALRARELWEAAERAAGRPILHRTGGVMVGKPGSRTVAGSRRSAERWHIDHEILDPADLHRRFPAMSPAEDEVGCYEPGAGLATPGAGVAAHLDLAHASGAELRFCEPALAWRALGAGGVAVLAPDATHTADRLVLCPGAWGAGLLADLGAPVRAQHVVQYRFTPQRGTSPLPAEQPTYIWEGESGEQVDGFPPGACHAGGVHLTFSRGTARATPEAVDRTISEEEIYRIAAFTGRCLPGLAGDFVRAETRVYTTVDRHFVLSRHPEHEQVALACGFSERDFQLAPAVGEILAELSLHGNTGYPIELFDAARFASAELTPSY